MICNQTGYGMAKTLPDMEVKQFIDSFFLPAFREGRMYERTYNGLYAIEQKLK
jgi:hypothetical protein